MEITQIVEQLKMHQHRDSTHKNYYLVWKLFNEFIIKLDIRPDTWEDRLTMFVGHIISEHKQSAMVKSYISAIKAVLKMNNIKIEEDRYLLASLICACRLQNDTVHARFPIQKPMLHVILGRVAGHFGCQPYLSLLYRTLFCIMYYGLLRVSEVTSGSHPVLASDIQIATNKKKILLILYSSKTHSKASTPQIIKISSFLKESEGQLRGSENDQCCPYSLLRQYALMHGNYKSDCEPFFVFSDRSPVTPKQMGKCIKMILRKAGFNEKLYGTHSMRAGRTCDLFKLGLSVETIKKLGRWKSNAVFCYLCNYC